MNTATVNLEIVMSVENLAEATDYTEHLIAEALRLHPDMAAVTQVNVRMEAVDTRSR